MPNQFVKIHCRNSATGALALLVVLAAGCSQQSDENGQSANDSSQSLKSVSVAGTPTSLFVLKNDKPFVLMNLASDAGPLRSMSAEDQQTHLIRRATETLIESALDREDYAGKNSFVVKIIVLTELDNYGRANWGTAVELATLEFERSKLESLAKQDIAQLDVATIHALPNEPRYILANLGSIRSVVR